MQEQSSKWAKNYVVWRVLIYTTHHSCILLREAICILLVFFIIYLTLAWCVECREAATCLRTAGDFYISPPDAVLSRQHWVLFLGWMHFFNLVHTGFSEVLVVTLDIVSAEEPEVTTAVPVRDVCPCSWKSSLKNCSSPFDTWSHFAAHMFFKAVLWKVNLFFQLQMLKVVIQPLMTQCWSGFN